MIKTQNVKLHEKIERIYEERQDHIIRFWDSLNEQQRGNLLAQIDMIDFDLLSRLAKQALEENQAVSLEKMEPPEVIDLKKRQYQDKEARITGAEAISQGKMAAFLVAGGQGTRLGFNAPKGMYPVTPVKKKSLFQLHAEKILASGNQHNVTIPWYIMTSLTNIDQTTNYFAENDYFGLAKEDIFVFVQDMIPAIDREGKLILDRPDHIFMNPNGHGGSIQALWKSGALVDMKNRGIDYVFYFQVDNVLTRICDPVYLGYHIQAGSEMSCKVVHKKYPEEKIGILGRFGNEMHMVEYSDLSKEDMYAKMKDESLKYWAGNIATHIFDRQFLERENEGGFKLPFHIAEKNIPYLDQNGDLIKPDDKNGIKFETFVFDALVDAKQTVCVEVERESEFSPLKNQDGENSPQTVRLALISNYAGWLENAGFEILRDDDGYPLVNIEISPLVSLQGEGMEAYQSQSKRIIDDLYIGT
jgi:UDP-N-acetylglucosamine/UDP-N-acetylgalactosamine diphosphorylase